MSETQIKINELKSKLTGDMMSDMEIRDEIHTLEMQENGVEPSCSMEEGCISCGS